MKKFLLKVGRPLPGKISQKHHPTPAPDIPARITYMAAQSFESGLTLQ
jgi:hypothetical protein